ncbi:MAG TPA: helix-turn-helix transcriptional regulator [Candidatus Saccharimonadales bacterium]|nr:helix-turn-helix transcriptional regulator [Candidatus Saccharimonadales bacterium]
MRTTAAPKSPAPPRVSPIAGESDFLHWLGTRVRELRNRRGLTRKTMSREARISERHLAQIECGEGNVSIALLRRIAVTLGVTLQELFETRPANPEKQALGKLLSRLPPARLKEVLSKIQSEFAPQESERRRRIALIGLRGAGKSTLGSRLGRETGTAFIELDVEIEKETGMSLADIFSLYGQNGYRSIEHRVLEHVLRVNRAAVLSVGGGIVSERDTYELLLSKCYTVWIKARPDEHMSRVMAQGDFRAMAGNDGAMEDLRRILAAREPLYRQADAQLDTSGSTVDTSFAKLKALIDSARQ